MYLHTYIYTYIRVCICVYVCVYTQLIIIDNLAKSVITGAIYHDIK